MALAAVSVTGAGPGADLESDPVSFTHRPDSPRSAHRHPGTERPLRRERGASDGREERETGERRRNKTREKEEEEKVEEKRRKRRTSVFYFPNWSEEQEEKV